MFADMIKKKLLLTENECYEVIVNSTSGVLSLAGTNGYPYTVPLSYACAEGKLWFHGAKKGYKMDCVKENPKAAFCIVDKDIIIPSKLTSHFRSVNIFGTVRVLESDEERRKALNYLVDRYSSKFKKIGDEEIERLWSVTATYALEIEHITGKASIAILDAEYGR